MRIWPLPRRAGKSQISLTQHFLSSWSRVWGKTRGFWVKFAPKNPNFGAKLGDFGAKPRDFEAKLRNFGAKLRNFGAELPRFAPNPEIREKPRNFGAKSANFWHRSSQVIPDLFFFPFKFTFFSLFFSLSSRFSGFFGGFLGEFWGFFGNSRFFSPFSRVSLRPPPPRDAIFGLKIGFFRFFFAL